MTALPAHTESQMSNRFWRRTVLLLALGLAAHAAAQSVSVSSPPQPTAPQVWTWDAVKDRFQLYNATLLAGKLNIDELKADEITAHLRPNPNLALLSDQIDPFNAGPDHGPFAYW